MKTKSTEENQRKKEFYRNAVTFFDEMCISDDDEHYESLKYIKYYIEELNIGSILDLGCGIGRVVGWLNDNTDLGEIIGIDPMMPMLAAAKQRKGREILTCADGRDLPLKDKAVDASCEFGILHHDIKPLLIVNEML